MIDVRTLHLNPLIDELNSLSSLISSLNESISLIKNKQNHFKPVVVISNMATTNSTLEFPINKLNVKVVLTKTSADNIRISMSSISGPVVVDIKKWAFYDGSGVDNSSYDSLSLSETLTTIDGTVYMSTRDGPFMEIWNGPVCWRVNILISGNTGQRVRVYAYPVTDIDVTI